MIDDTRWRAAQRLELAFWKSWKTLGPYRDLDIPAYWRGELGHFGVAPRDFAGKRVLDVGCGPEGLIHYVEGAAARIRVDPLLPQYGERRSLEGAQLSLCAMGEALPLADASVDVAICFNALDHMLNPAAAVDEIARVLRPGGTALFMIHTFPGWTRPVHFVDRMHPHHYTAGSFAALVEGRFEIRQEYSSARRFDMAAREWLSPAAWKYRLAGGVVSSTYLRGERRGQVEPPVPS